MVFVLYLLMKSFCPIIFYHSRDELKYLAQDLGEEQQMAYLLAKVWHLAAIYVGL